MKKILVCIEDEQFNLLEGRANKSQLIREALNVYIGHISTDTVAGFRSAFKQTQENTLDIKNELKEINSKLDYLTKRLDR